MGFDLLSPAIEHERYRHLIVDVREPDSFPSDLEPQVIGTVAGTQDSADDIAANLYGTINVTERYAFAGEGLAAKPASAIKSVVNVGSASGHTGSEFPDYAASKGGVIAYTKNLANRLAPQAIANSVDPGGVITPLNRCVMEDEHLWNQIMELTPLKRWATAQEIAEWIYFVGVTNRFMTGQSLLIDGGEAGRTQLSWPE
ncbi:MAG: SDR family NAD(P)-dependent oxidoreductase [Collinsella sp.]